MAVLPARSEHEAGAGSAAWPTRLRVAAGACLLIASIYMIAIPGQLAHWWLFGLIFLGVALLQVRLAGALLRRATTAALLAGIWGNLGVAGLYLWSRTVGLPFGPVTRSTQHAAHSAAVHAPIDGGVGNGIPILPQPQIGSRVQAVGALELGTIALEFAVVVILVSLLPASHRRWTTNTMCAFGLALWTLRWSGVLN